MPGLSSSTLNLKFMQRGAARTPSTPSTPIPKPSGSSTPRIESSGPAVSAPETPTVEEPILVASEEPYRWSLARSTKFAQTPSGVKFETSYLPFIDQTRDESPEAGPSKGGGGRMVFGYKEPEQEDLEKEEGNEGEEEEDDVVINVKKEKEREKGKREYKKPRPMMNEKGFMRPRSRSRSPERNGGGKGSLLPTTPRHGHRQTLNSKYGDSEKDSRKTQSSNSHSKSDHSKSRTGEGTHRVKIEPSSPPAPPSTSTPKPNGDQKSKKRKPSQSTPSSSKFNINTTGTTSTSDKKPKLSSPTMINDYPTQVTQGSQSTAIDDREAALKAQRKKEKNAKKKARKSAE
jgi:hypothetical protein